MNKYTIIASCEYGDGTPDEITIKGIQGTFANEVYDSVEKGFWKRVQACNGCAFEDKEEWEMPCSKCKRISKDYYRSAEDSKKE